MKKRKNDRRTRYTIMVIKTAFLELTKDVPFNKITVTQVCQRAEITRSTFYLHYDSLNDLLNEVLDDAIVSTDETNELVSQYLKDNESLLSTCQQLGSDPQYRHLLMDPDLSEYIINRIIRHEQSRVLPSIMKKTSLSQDDAASLFNYIIHGSFAVNKAHQFKKDDHWYHDVSLLNRFINAGYEHLKKSHE